MKVLNHWQENRCKKSFHRRNKVNPCAGSDSKIKTQGEYLYEPDFPWFDMQGDLYEYMLDKLASAEQKWAVSYAKAYKRNYGSIG